MFARGKFGVWRQGAVATQGLPASPQPQSWQTTTAPLRNPSARAAKNNNKCMRDATIPFRPLGRTHD
jgi:hypothetical protein